MRERLRPILMIASTPSYGSQATAAGMGVLDEEDWHASSSLARSASPRASHLWQHRARSSPQHRTRKVRAPQTPWCWRCPLEKGPEPVRHARSVRPSIHASGVAITKNQNWQAINIYVPLSVHLVWRRTARGVAVGDRTRLRTTLPILRPRRSPLVLRPHHASWVGSSFVATCGWVPTRSPDPEPPCAAEQPFSSVGP
ncbi:hypothetical protein GSI_13462 [Ganoderma sinense ZZ0214-1]|uniref:Uncharacterized protein n=1 Tax=Ganoderma sinense ZZ0214-1 TaxID=1077348 RepID=A0A2G8RQD1_9APHY|nr:hypothetical protein GSI_13462 [Ganoderma sinense ZZ0214-1]